MALKDRNSRNSLVKADSVTPGELTYVGASSRTTSGAKCEVPTIILRGEWLKALGFPIGAPICVFAEANRRMAIYRMGLGRPRWLRIVAPKRSR